MLHFLNLIFQRVILAGQLFLPAVQLVALRFQNAINQVDNTARLKAVKHDIARIKTTLRQAELAAEAEEDAIADAFYLAELAAEAEEDAIADALFKAEFDYQDAIALPF